MGALQLSSVNSLSGGRHLDAIDFCPDLTSADKSILHCIASQLDYTGDFQEERWMYISTIQARTSLSRATIFRCLRSLQARGYLIRRQVVSDQAPKLMASFFRLLPKLFLEHASRLEKQAVNRPTLIVDPSHHETGVVSPRDGGSLTVRQKAPACNPSYSSIIRRNSHKPKWQPRGQRPVSSMFQTVPACYTQPQAPAAASQEEPAPPPPQPTTIDPRAPQAPRYGSVRTRPAPWMKQ